MALPHLERKLTLPARKLCNGGAELIDNVINERRLTRMGFFARAGFALARTLPNKQLETPEWRTSKSLLDL